MNIDIHSNFDWLREYYGDKNYIHVVRCLYNNSFWIDLKINKMWFLSCDPFGIFAKCI